MSFFLDSNVIIGYFFSCGDSFGRSSAKVFENGEKIYSSSNVWNECWGAGNGGKCRKINDEITDEFSSAIYYLNSGEFGTDDMVMAAIGEQLRIREIIEYLYEKYSSNKKIFIDRLREAQRKFENDCNLRKSILNNNSTITIHCRTNNYPVIEQYLDATVPDHSDVKILIDAHDLGLTIQDSHLLAQMVAIYLETNLQFYALRLLAVLFPNSF